ncbi:MAG: phosphotransferase [Streptosporangiaceae bacterium]
MTEIPLSGGNSNEVVRVGATVRRRIPPNGEAVHVLLAHLEAAGFPATPRFLGIDDQGREVLSYIEGEPGLHPHTAAVRSPAALTAMVRLARRYHDATAGFVPRAAGLTWPGKARDSSAAEVVCHGDLAPYNMIFRGAVPGGIVDFDNAAPGSRVDDVAYLAYRLAPLTAERNYADAGWPADVDREGRLRQIAAAYGPLDYSPVLDIVLERLAGMRDWIRARAAEGDPAVAVHLREDHMGIYEADMAWIAARRGLLLARLGA